MSWKPVVALGLCVVAKGLELVAEHIHPIENETEKIPERNSSSTIPSPPPAFDPMTDEARELIASNVFPIIPPPPRVPLVGSLEARMSSKRW